MDKVIFLDRDGVINQSAGDSYIENSESFIFLPGVFNAFKLLDENKYRVFIISNQSGVSKGIYTFYDLELIDKKMTLEVQKYGGNIEGIMYCPHDDKDNCLCRKPKTGLFVQAVEKYNLNIDKDRTFYIGDSLLDIEAGKKYGLKTILVLCGKSKLEDVEKSKLKPDYIKENLFEAVKFIING